MSISRRHILRLLGTSAAGAALGPALAACGAAPTGPADPDGALHDVERLRARLAEQVYQLSSRYPRAWARAEVRRRGTVSVDASDASIQRTSLGWVVFGIADRTGAIEHATDDLSADGIARAAVALRARAPVGAERAGTIPDQRRDFAVPLAHDPRRQPARDWIAGVRTLHDRALRVGGSRIVHRSAHLVVDDSDILFVGGRRDLHQRLVRTRAGALLVAWAGEEPTVEAASRAGSAGLELLAITDDELTGAADRALALLTPTRPPAGATEVILAPSVSALLAERGIARALCGEAWRAGRSRAAALMGQKVGSPWVTIIDDARASGGYGSYYFDDEGVAARTVRVIESGVLRSPLTTRADADGSTGHGRRAPLGPVRARPSNIGFAPGAARRSDLLTAVARGLLIEGGIWAHIEPASWRMTLRAARAHEIADGRLTGRLYGNVDLRADVPALLGAVRAVGNATESHATDSDVAIARIGADVWTRAEVLG